MQLSDLPPGVSQFDQRINPTEDDMASLRPPPPEVCDRVGHDGYIDDLIAGTMRCARCGADLTGSGE